MRLNGLVLDTPGLDDDLRCPDEIANLLREISENELDGFELFCSILDSNEVIRLSESDCEESEVSVDIIDNIN
ncbi:hypothetical protein TNCV_4160921 [Trichonephila clavipes]|nr:hypothetical protein TNCV_4160921 [Trichonephila clavipes]